MDINLLNEIVLNSFWIFSIEFIKPSLYPLSLDELGFGMNTIDSK